MKRARLWAAQLIVTVLVFASPALAQTSWWRTYGGANYDCGWSAQQTSDGGYIIAGWTESFGAGSKDAYLVKTNASGDTQWTRAYGGTDEEVSYSVQQTSDGGYVMAGYTSSFGAGQRDVYLIKTNNSGDTLWTRTYGGTDFDYGYSVRQTTDGGYIIAGCTYSYGAGSGDVWLIKTDASGNKTWDTTFGGGSPDGACFIRQTSDGGYIIAGATRSFGAWPYDVYLIKTNASGDTLWTRIYGGTEDDLGWSVEQTSDGGYVSAGVTGSFGAGNGDVYLIKTNASGDTLWTRTCGGTSEDSGYSVQQTSDGGYIIAGVTGSFGTGGDDVCLIKIDANGDTLWTRTYGGTSEDGGYSVRQTSDGGYIIAGGTYSFGAGNCDLYLIKTDSLGHVGVAEERPKSVDGKPVATVIRELPQSVAVFDAMGKRVLKPRPGIYFLRIEAAAGPCKVLLVK